MTKISVLCVTHERPEFMPWLLWNYGRLANKETELVIVDSSEEPFARKQKGVRVIAAPGANVPEKRNMAMDAAKGELITWLDDDDWRHPDSLKILAQLIDEDVPLAGGRRAWFMDLQTTAVRRFTERRRLLFACLLVKADMARAYRFDETKERGSDVDWYYRLTDAQPFRFTSEPMSIFLCHDRNIGNTAEKQRFNRPVDDVRSAISKAAWGKTGHELMALRKRLYGN